MKTFLALAGLLTLLAACSHEGSSPSSTSDYGTGLNTVDRKYAKTAPQVHDAALQALGKMDVKVNRDRHDAMGSEIAGERADKSKVMVNVRALDEHSSRATIRVEPGDSRMATMVHEKIADELGMSTAKGAATDMFPYDAELQAAVDAVQRAAKDLGYTVTGTQVQDTWAQVDARTPDSTPLRIRMERVKNPEFPLNVTFSGGENTIVQFHDAFDREVGGHVK